MLECKSLTYHTKNKALVKDFNQKFKAGKMTAIIGPNGAGKSTLLHLLTGDIKSKKKNIYWQNKPISSFSNLYWSQNRGILTQSLSSSMGFTNHEIVMMGRYPYFKKYPEQKDHQIIEESMIQTQTENLKSRFYDGLSGGEKQRVHLARVFAQINNSSANSKLLLLDEPLNNLDVKHQHKLMEHSCTIAHQGNTVVAVLHDINLAAAYADEIVLINEGSKVASGTPFEVLTKNNLEQAYDIPTTIKTTQEVNYPMIFFNAVEPKENFNTTNYQNQLA